MKANFHAEVRKGIGTRPRVIFRYHEGQILAATTHIRTFYYIFFVNNCYYYCFCFYYIMSGVRGVFD